MNKSLKERIEEESGIKVFRELMDEFIKDDTLEGFGSWYRRKIKE